LRGGVKPGDTLLIAGLGPIGALTVLAAAAAGATEIYVSEPNESRRRFVDDFGVTSVSYDPAKGTWCYPIQIWAAIDFSDYYWKVPSRKENQLSHSG
jgi:threonine dehydrogenase-like Zn-dependent dehydrogenase